jgi:iron complex transport system substrate-binding protein
MDDVDSYAAAVDLGLKIHRDPRPGMLESVYEGILAGELRRAGLEVERQRPMAIEYNGFVYQEGFRADLIVGGKLIIEIKSIDRLAPVHSRQLLTYLRMAKLTVGLLMNFGAATFREGVRRIANNHPDLDRLTIVSGGIEA